MDIIDNYEVIKYRNGDIFKYDTIRDYEHNDTDPMYIHFVKGAKYNCSSREILTVYYKNGICHREGDLPAVILKNGFFEQFHIYVKNGQIHRDNNLPAIIATMWSNVFNLLTPEQAQQYIEDNNMADNTMQLPPEQAQQNIEDDNMEDNIMQLTHLYYFKFNKCYNHIY